MNTYKAFADRLREVMKEKGLLQKDLAEMADTSDQSVSNWIHGTAKPYPKTLIPLCSRIGINAQWLLTGEGPRDAGPEVSFSRRPNRSATPSPDDSKELRLARERVEILKLQIEEAELRKKLAELEGKPATGVTPAGFKPRREGHENDQGDDSENEQTGTGRHKNKQGKGSKNLQR